MRAIVVMLSLMLFSIACSAEMPDSEDKIILTISGNIEKKNEDGQVQFNIASLKKLGMESFYTSSPWYEGRTKFEGVPLNKLMDAVGARGHIARVIALNDYVTTIPLEDFKKYPVILALKVNDKYMQVRDKGPLFIVYPYDSKPELNNQIYYSRSAWQVYKIIIQ